MAPTTAMLCFAFSMDDAHNHFHNAGAKDGVSASFAVGSVAPIMRAIHFGDVSAGSYTFCAAMLCSGTSVPVS